PTAKAMATGRSRRSCAGRARTWTPGRSRGEAFDQLRRELRSLPLVLVLEVDEGIVPVVGMGADDVRPSIDVGQAVAFVPQTEVPEVGCDDDGCVSRLAVGHAERDILRAQPIVDLVGPPRFMAEFHRGAGAWRQFGEK